MPASIMASDPTVKKPKPTLTNQPETSASLVILRGPEHLPAWTRQTKNFAKQLGCYDCLHDGSTPPSPRDSTDAFLLRTRVENATHIILSTVGSAVYAHARVLGYDGDARGKDPTQLFRLVCLAAERMYEVHRGKQPADQARRLVAEWTNARPENYPRQVQFGNALAWMEKMIRRRYEAGDAEMAHAIGAMDLVDRELELSSDDGSSGRGRKRSASPDADTVATEETEISYPDDGHVAKKHISDGFVRNARESTWAAQL